MHYSYVLCVLQPTERTTVNSMNETKITVEMRKRFIEICVNSILHFKEDKLNIQTKKNKKTRQVYTTKIRWITVKAQMTPSTQQMLLPQKLDFPLESR